MSRNRQKESSGKKIIEWKDERPLSRSKLKNSKSLFISNSEHSISRKRRRGIGADQGEYIHETAMAQQKKKLYRNSSVCKTTYWLQTEEFR